MIGLSVSGIVLYFYRYSVARKLTKKFEESHGNKYMKFQYIQVRIVLSGVGEGLICKHYQGDE